MGIKKSFAKKNYKGFTKTCVTHHKRAYNSSFSDEVITIKNNQQFRKLPPNSAVVNLLLSLFLVAYNIFLCYNKIKTYFLIQIYFIVIRKENLHGYIHQLFNKAME